MSDVMMLYNIVVILGFAVLLCAVTVGLHLLWHHLYDNRFPRHRRSDPYPMDFVRHVHTSWTDIKRMRDG